MANQENLEDFWQTFLETRNLPASTPFIVWDLSLNKTEATKLRQLILTDEKKVVASLYDAYLIWHKPLPKVGDFALILEEENVVAVLKISAVDLRPFYQVGEIEALLQGASSLKEWQASSAESFQKEALQWGVTFQKESLIVLEMFERLEVVSEVFNFKK